MTSDPDPQRIIRVPILTRVEGEGALHIALEGDRVAEVQLNIYEPPRFFEALLRGKRMEDVADITSRICGICPIAYQMTAVQALESIVGATIDPQIAQLRRLIYCAEWIESHVLHIHLLHAPDFFDCADAMELAKRFPMEVRRGLQLKQLGNRVLEILGGRAIHPVNIAIGGFYRLPPRESILGLLPDMEQGLESAIAAARWLKNLSMPNFEVPYQLVALTHPDEYPIDRGDIAISNHATIPMERYEEHFGEQQVPHSTALQSIRLHDSSTYFVGPLARVQLNYDRLTPRAKEVAAELGLDQPCRNPHCSIWARAVEVIYAFEESIAILRSFHMPSRPRSEWTPRAGEGMSATEAPRGLIFHRYRIDASGLIEFAKIVPPTSQNQGQIESDLRRLLPSLVHHPDIEIGQQCERLVRAYDPCISCSTHFLRVRIERK
jgi:sulfhydrogenase subunit alpha